MNFTGILRNAAVCISMSVSRISAITIFVLVAAPAFAEQLGTISAEYDGTQHEWFTVTVKMNDRTVGTATFSEGRMLTDVHMQGHPRPNFTTMDVISLDVSYRSPFEAGAAPMIMEVIHMPTGMKPPIWTSEHTGTPAVIAFDTLDTHSGHASGTFEATLCKVANLGADPDTSDCKPIKGTFDTGLVVE
jgi:hypothetical protein